MINIDLIKIEGTQSRAQLNQEVVNEYAEAMKCGAKFPPLKLFFDGSDYWLADGFHRYFASKIVEITEINADIENGSKDEAILYSIGSNISHGLRRTNADKRHAVGMILAHKVWSTWSDRAIANEAGVDHKFVGKLRAELSQKVGTVPTTPTPMLEASPKKEVLDPILESEIKAELPIIEPEYTEQDALKDSNKELSKMVENLNIKLATQNYDGAENVENIIAELKKENDNLVIELNAVKKSRDSYMNENAQLKKQVAMMRKQLDKK